MVLAAVMVWTAACGPSSGLQFEIDASGDPTATEIMVYVGSGYGETASIAGEGLSPETIYDGKFWPLTFDSAEVVKLSGNRTATVSFVPGDGIEWLTIVVVGLTDGVRTSVATKINAAVRGDVVEVWDMVLEPASTDVKISAGRAVTWWGEEPDQTTCVQAVDRSEPKGNQNVFIGLSGDKDCDGFEHGKREECDDEWHHAAFTPSQDTLSCVEPNQIPDSNAGTSAVCMFGSRDCRDGMPEARVDCSHALPYCAPQGLCSECSEGTPEESFRCALGLDPRQNPTVAFVHCPIQVDASQSPPRLCDQTLVAVPASGWFGALTMCAGPPLFHPPEPYKPWVPTAEIGNVQIAFSAGTSLSTCNLEIGLSVKAGTTFDRSKFPDHGLVSVDVDPGAAVVVPIVFDLVDTTLCRADIYCTVVQGTAAETIGKCVRLAPTRP